MLEADLLDLARRERGIDLAVDVGVFERDDELAFVGIRTNLRFGGRAEPVFFALFAGDGHGRLDKPSSFDLANADLHVARAVAAVDAELAVNDFFKGFDKDALDAQASPGDGQIIECHCALRLTKAASTKAGRARTQGEMPIDLAATTSLKADIRPKTLVVASSIVPGTANCIAWGNK